MSDWHRTKFYRSKRGEWRRVVSCHWWGNKYAPIDPSLNKTLEETYLRLQEKKNEITTRED